MPSKVLGFFLLPALAAGFVLAQSTGPLQDPILRVEAGMHTARINRIAVDRDNLYLATASDHDKSVRVWELSTGRLLRVLRPPIGDEWEGNIFAVALSPDGRTVACGGYSGYTLDKFESIYLFELSSGRMVGRIPRVSKQGIARLVFSPDGHFLAAAMYKPAGLRVFRTSDWLLVAEDRDYGGDTFGADFASDGRLVTGSYDGFIRVYDSDFKLVLKREAVGGKKPYSVKISPDGTKIAVGFLDAVGVDVLSGDDLKQLASLRPDGTTAIGGIVVAWASDGRFLYTGGTWKIGGKHVIRRWLTDPWSTKPTYADSVLKRSGAIAAIAPLADGGVAFGAHAPALGRFDALGKLALFRGRPTAYFSPKRQDFLVAPDGTVVQFVFQVDGIDSAVARFSIEDRLLQLEPPAPTRLYAARTSAPDFPLITEWRYSFQPKIAGKALKFTDGPDKSSSLAIAPGRDAFLLGTAFSVQLFDRDGNRIWRKPTPWAEAVNISRDGRIALAAFRDGTIRWYRMEDGEEILTLFLHADRKRWVLWTPSGYYDASAGGEELLGWHLNRGADQEADFFPASRFRSIYYRPDVVARVFQTLDEAQAIRLANKESGREEAHIALRKMLPPVVEILSPADGTAVSTAKVELRVSVRSIEPITEIRALVDGRPVSRDRGMAPIAGGTVHILPVHVPERDSEVSVIAESRHGASVPATVQIKWAGPDAAVAKPRLYVLAVGVSEYEDESLRLNYAAKDAQDFVAVMSTQEGGLYREVVTRTLTEDAATREAILDGLDWITQETTSKDVATVFFAGHGVNDTRGTYYFLPADVNTERLRSTGVVFFEIQRTVSTLAGKAVFFLDTCHSGNVTGETRRGVADITAVVNELVSAENGAVVFASSTGRQYSLEDPAWGNGAFTKALVEGIAGRADFMRSGKITINSLDLYLAERVKELTEGRQTPTTTKPDTIPDFPLATVQQ